MFINYLCKIILSEKHRQNIHYFSKIIEYNVNTFNFSLQTLLPEFNILFKNKGLHIELKKVAINNFEHLNLKEHIY